MSTAEPKWDEIRELHAEIRRLRDAGEWTQAKYKALLPRAKTAVGSSTALIESFHLQGYLARE